MQRQAQLLNLRPQRDQTIGVAVMGDVVERDVDECMIRDGSGSGLQNKRRAHDPCHRFW